MSDEKTGLLERFPLTWMFHRNTSRWTFNTLAPSQEDSPEPPREILDTPFVTLPESVRIGGRLMDAIHQRHSCRHFCPSAVPLVELSTILKYAYGFIGESSYGALPFYERPVPSGGGMYPLDLYVIANRPEDLVAGVYRYAPVTHGLESVREGSLSPHVLTYLCMGQSYAGYAPVLIVIGTNFVRAMKKYGDRGYRYILLEAGHVAQNINLLSASMGIGNCNIGGFYDVELASLLRMDLAVEAPLYVVALGKPTYENREASRALD